MVNGVPGTDLVPGSTDEQSAYPENQEMACDVPCRWLDINGSYVSICASKQSDREAPLSEQAND
jgi:hypothetical protein